MPKLGTRAASRLPDDDLDPSIFLRAPPEWLDDTNSTESDSDVELDDDEVGGWRIVPSLATQTSTLRFDVDDDVVVDDEPPFDSSLERLVRFAFVGSALPDRDLGPDFSEEDGTTDDLERDPFVAPDSL